MAAKQALEDLFNWIPPSDEELQEEAKKERGKYILQCKQGVP